mmetsp:Transcript_35413/g.65064  ORF Transcript_35413/g.65064 Transcript_35413/m.65064 type:complete len:252 (+) Transcript_35413:511-1266(+)
MKSARHPFRIAVNIQNRFHMLVDLRGNKSIQTQSLQEGVGIGESALATGSFQCLEIGRTIPKGGGRDSARCEDISNVSMHILTATELANATSHFDGQFVLNELKDFSRQAGREYVVEDFSALLSLHGRTAIAGSQKAEGLLLRQVAGGHGQLELGQGQLVGIQVHRLDRCHARVGRQRQTIVAPAHHGQDAEMVLVAVAPMEGSQQHLFSGDVFVVGGDEERRLMLLRPGVSIRHTCKESTHVVVLVALDP